MSGETLPGTPGADERRIVLHVDMDCFYASCERLRDPELADEPLVVGMGYDADETHGAVATASYEAREFGVESAQPISTALELLPRRDEERLDDGDADAGYYRPVDLEFYEEIADRVREVLHDCADVVREVSIDEAYLDVTGRTSWQTVDGDSRTLAEGFARHVRERIDREVGVPASVGVAPNMSTAKVASDHDKPDGLVVVEPGEVQQFLAPLPVESVHGVGPVTARELGELGIETAGDLAAADPTELRNRFGERGRELYDRARGYDDREVTPTGRPKSLSRESAFVEATDETDAKREKVRALAADVAERARRRGAMYRTIGVKVVTPPFDVNTRARSLSGPVDDPDLVESVALDLLAEFADDEVRKLGVRVSKLSFAAEEQASLDGWEGSKPAQTSEGNASRSDDAAEVTETTGDLRQWLDADEHDDAAAADSGPGRQRNGQASLGEFE
ncbi:DNA polymerase IV (DinB-like DNA polymerase) [Halogranum amylolyticum]|uniref:DNA polymerase IV n=1 Tax=Halogranum amylolyticum TaxID=660520 RepID=A0A1H8SIK4_9EURY|nr:DNA polymerase IV [Halogranum amylolyticum]SEO78013.1 DNA polymerase IV (DinB-like DNA polymerase) [Halogranum amylolyticum]